MDGYIDEEIKKIKGLINQKALDDARKKLNSVLSVDKKNAEAYYLYGYVEVLSNNYPLAVSLFKLSLEHNSLNANAAYYIGLCAEKQGLLTSAMVFYRKALELNPNHAMAREKVPAPSRHNQATELKNPTPSFNVESVIRDNKIVTPHKFESKSCRSFTGPVSEFYERLTLDKSFEAQRAAQIIKEIELEITPRLIDYWLSFLLLMFVPLLPFFLQRFGGGLAIIFIIVLILFKMVAVKRTHYYFSNGNLTVSKGVFSVKSTKWELYRVENIEWDRDTFGRSTIKLQMMHTKSPVKLRGVGSRQDAEYISNRLNELVRLLRMYSSLKGVIN